MTDGKTKNYVLFSCVDSNSTYYMMFTVPSESPGFGVLTYFAIDDKGKHWEMGEPFDISISNGGQGKMRNWKFRSSDIYPIEVLRDIWDELLKDERAGGWRSTQPLSWNSPSDTAKVYITKAENIINAAPFGGMLPGPPTQPVHYTYLTPRRSSRRPFVPSPELIEDMRAAGENIETLTWS